jgi:hypothetical protein
MKPLLNTFQSHRRQGRKRDVVLADTAIHLKLMKFVSENFLQGNSHRIGMPREHEAVLLASPSLSSSIATRPSSEQVYMKPSSNMHRQRRKPIQPNHRCRLDEFDLFKINCNSMNEKWSPAELSPLIVREEEMMMRAKQGPKFSCWLLQEKA